MNSMRNLLKKYEEIIFYLFWGGMTTLVSWSSYSIFALFFSKNTSKLFLLGVEVSVAVLLANILSWVCAIMFAYVTNKLWVFRSRSWKREVVLPELGKFVSARAITGILEIVLVPLLTGMGLNQTIFGIEGMASKILVSVLIVALNYVFSKLFVFKKENRQNVT